MPYTRFTAYLYRITFNTMSHLAFFSDNHWAALHPFGNSYAHGHLRVGAFKLSEWWSREARSFFLNAEQKTKANVLHLLKNGKLNDRWIPSEHAFSILARLNPEQSLYADGTLLFQPSTEREAQPLHVGKDGIELIAHATELFSRLNGWLNDQRKFLIDAWELEAPNVPQHVSLIGPTDQIWIHPSATLTACTLNATSGPIFIGPDVEIQEGAHIRGPLAIGEATVIKMGTRIYGPTSIGPNCRIGGEVSNCAFLGYSNKGHDGFLGNSVIGKWCNLGADTNSSNLKSNYSNVRLWNEATATYVDSGLQFCGVLMGDHSKCGINTMFNTGTIVGAGCNIFGCGFQPKQIPAFAWGGNETWELHTFDKFIATAQRVMERRGATLSEEEISHWRAQHEAARARFD